MRCGSRMVATVPMTSPTRVPARSRSAATRVSRSASGARSPGVTSRPVSASTSRTSAGSAASASRQPRRPHQQRGPSGTTVRWPILPCTAVAAAADAAVGDGAHADAAADGHHDQVRDAPAGPEEVFRDGQGVDVVVDEYGQSEVTTEQLAQVVLDPVREERPGHLPRRWVDHAGHADAETHERPLVESFPGDDLVHERPEHSKGAGGIDADAMRHAGHREGLGVETP